MEFMNRKVYENLDILPEDISGWGGDSPIFNELIKKILPNLIIEVGTWKGQSAITMALALKDLGMDSKIYCVDTWLGSLEFLDDNKDERNLMYKNGYPQIYYQFLSNVVHKKLENIIIPFPQTSDISFRFFKEKNITADLIYIDGSHNYEDVLRDLNNYYTLLNYDGIIFGDDYNWSDVNKAVNEFSLEKNIEVTINDRFWIIRK